MTTALPQTPIASDLRRFIGWFDSFEQSEPTHDPAHDGPCIVCARPLTADDVRTVSVCAMEGSRSLFYRLHRTCGDALSAHDSGELDVAVLAAADRIATEPA